jgi:hypothetical protein
MRSLNIAFFLAFVLSLAVQYNDPDPLVWMAFYGASALACLAFHYQRLHWQLAALLSCAALTLVIWLTPRFLGQVTGSEIVESLTMQTRAVEEAREAGGAALVAIWAAALSWHSKNRERTAGKPSSE